jgi:hypothetical protein
VRFLGIPWAPSGRGAAFCLRGTFQAGKTHASDIEVILVPREKQLENKAGRTNERGGKEMKISRKLTYTSVIAWRRSQTRPAAAQCLFVERHTMEPV